jgi:hypothetical protein
MLPRLEHGTFLIRSANDNQIILKFGVTPHTDMMLYYHVTFCVMQRDMNI